MALCKLQLCLQGSNFDLAGSKQLTSSCHYYKLDITNTIIICTFLSKVKENTYAKCILDNLLNEGCADHYITVISPTDKVDAVVGRMGKGQYIQLYSCHVHKS